MSPCPTAEDRCGRERERERERGRREIERERVRVRVRVWSDAANWTSKGDQRLE